MSPGYINDQVVDVVEEYKDLGTLIDTNYLMGILKIT